MIFFLDSTSIQDLGRCDAAEYGEPGATLVCGGGALKEMELFGGLSCAHEYKYKYKCKYKAEQLRRWNHLADCHGHNN